MIGNIETVISESFGAFQNRPITREQLRVTEIRPERRNFALGGVKHSILDGLGMRVAEKQENSESSSIIPGKQALALESDRLLLIHQLVN